MAKYSGSTITATYLLGLGGEQVTEFNGSGTWMHTNVWAAGGKLLATYEGPGESSPNTYHFHLTDWLGTQRLQTNATGNQEEACYSYPFGDGLSCTGSDATEHHFTSKMRDSESGLDYFGARYLNSSLARFMTPDWSGKPTDVPYATFGNPQTINLYAYVNNNPNSAIDLDGHYTTTQAVGSFLDSYCDTCDPMNPMGSSSGSGSGSSSTSPSGATTDSAQQNGGTPAPSNPSPNDPVAQQTTGRQPDGSYVAPTGPGSEIYNRTHGGKDGQVLHPPDDTKGQCVTACKHFSGITAPTTAWREGAAVSGNSSLRIGTAIATFGSNGRYPTNGDQNSGIYMGQGSKPGSILILDQWPAYGAPLNTPAHPPSVREMQLNDSYGHSMSNSASAYHVIIVP